MCNEQQRQEAHLRDIAFKTVEVRREAKWIEDAYRRGRARAYTGELSRQRARLIAADSIILVIRGEGEGGGGGGDVL